MKKDTLHLVIVGHVDHGKSTLIGRLLLDTGSLPKEKIAEIKKISRELGRDTELAYLADQLKEERERCITIDTMQTFFKTRGKNYVIIDAPGHVEFIKNMITGASLAEAAVLMVDAHEGIKEQTRRHAYLLGMLGLNNIVVVFNKMDLVNYSQERFDDVKKKLLVFLESLKIKPSFMIPLSAKEGINISSGSSKLGWYKGPSLLGALDSMKLDKKAEQKPLLLPVQDIYNMNDEKIIVGKVVSGFIKRGMEILVLPSGEEFTVRKIEVFGAQRKAAREGENIGVILDKTGSVKRGDTIVQKGDSPPVAVTCFKGDIFWMSGEPMRVNKKMTFRCTTQEVSCAAEKIEKRIDSSSLQLLEENAKELKLNESGVVLFRTERPVVIEKFSLIEESGRFVIERGFNLQGAGIITEKF